MRLKAARLPPEANGHNGRRPAAEPPEPLGSSVPVDPSGARNGGAHRGWARRVRHSLASLRLRIIGWYVLLLALALTASLLAVRQLLLVSIEERVQQDLVQEAEELRALAGGLDPRDGEPFGTRVDRLFEVFLRRNLPAPNETMVTFVGGRPFLRSVEDSPLRLDQDPALVSRWSVLQVAERGQVDTEEVGVVDYLAVPVSSGSEVLGVFVVAAFTEQAQATVDSVVETTAAVGVGALLLGLLLAWSVSSRVLAPVRDLTATARAISETDLQQRIEVANDDEMGQLAGTFNSMLDRLEEAFTGQRQFLDDAGHELRTPITIIHGHLELLEEEPAERAETIALVLDELDRMNRMVSDLLVLGKAQRPDFLHPGVVELRSLAKEVHTKAQALAPRRWVLDVRDDGQVVGDRQRLTQALVQLAKNATQHTAEGDVVTIGAAVARDVARIWVRDEGPGVPVEDQSRIFERFSRGSEGPRRSDGAGLGLSIVRAIAEAHRGRVELLSRPPAPGATFVLVLPLGPASPSAEGASA